MGQYGRRLRAAGGGVVGVPREEVVEGTPVGSFGVFAVEAVDGHVDEAFDVRHLDVGALDGCQLLLDAHNPCAEVIGGSNGSLQIVQLPARGAPGEGKAGVSAPGR